MSSLAAARADNFYYPPNYDPSKGSLNKFNGQHALRDRARKLDQGILIIRFEMPFNAWCEGCGHLIGKGVRFNAEKKAIGAYHSTKIWAFTMRAPCCQRRIEIHTDPKNTRYNIVEGAREKVETWTAADAETMQLDRSEDRARLDDPLAKLEHVTADKRRAKETRSRITELVIDADAKFRDDYAINKLLRAKNRVKRKDEQQRDRRRQALGLPDTVPLLPESPADARTAALVTFGDAHAFAKAQRAKRDGIREGSIFSPAAVAAGGAAVAAAAAAKEKQAAAAAQRQAVAQAASSRAGLAGGLPRAPIVQRGPTRAAPIPTIERRDRGSIAGLAKPPLSHPSASQRLSASSAAASQPEMIGRPGAAASRSKLSVGPAAVKRTSNDTAAQLALKRRRLAHGVTLGLSDPLQKT